MAILPIAILTQRTVPAIPARFAGASSVVTETVLGTSRIALDSVARCARPAFLTDTTLLLTPTVYTVHIADFYKTKCSRIFNQRIHSTGNKNQPFEPLSMQRRKQHCKYSLPHYIHWHC